METISNDALATFLARAASSTGNERRKARRAFLEALQADGYSARNARVLLDRFVSDARRAMENSESLASELRQSLAKQTKSLVADTATIYPEGLSRQPE
jgi:transposase